MKRQLWALRHAKPLVRPNTCYGQLDVAADAAHTLESAQALWAHWQAVAEPPPQVVWSSPLRRTRQMAEALETAGLASLVQFVPELKEMNFGNWEGRGWDEIGQDNLTGWTNNFWSHQVGGIQGEGVFVPSGESVSEFVERVERALVDLQAQLDFQPPQPSNSTTLNVLWVTHAGVIRVLDVLLQSKKQIPLTATDWPAHAPAPGGWQVFELD